MKQEIEKHMPRKRTKLTKLEPKKAYVPAYEDRNKELRQLIAQHLAYTTRSVAIKAMHSDRVVLGEERLCAIPVDDRIDALAIASAYTRKATQLKSHIEKAMAGHPVWDRFLKPTFGIGPIVAGYLLAYVDITIDIKPSQLRRYCGYAVDSRTGRLDRPTKGEVLHYNKHIRTRLYQGFMAMVKNVARTGGETKYTKLYRDTKYRLASSPLYDADKNTFAGKPGGKKHIDSAGRNKAITLFLDDLYMVWRAAEGLPVWPTFYEAKLKWSHGGDRIVENAPHIMTIDEALAMVGNTGLVGGKKLKAEELIEPEDIEELEDAAE